MSSIDIAMFFDGAARVVRPAETSPVFRVALYPGELLRIPCRGCRLHVISGTAWITAEGRDATAAAGESIDLPRSREPALVSGLRGQPLMMEVIRRGPQASGRSSGRS